MYGCEIPFKVNGFVRKTQDSPIQIHRALSV